MPTFVWSIILYVSWIISMRGHGAFAPGVCVCVRALLLFLDSFNPLCLRRSDIIDMTLTHTQTDWPWAAGLHIRCHYESWRRVHRHSDGSGKTGLRLASRQIGPVLINDLAVMTLSLDAITGRTAVFIFYFFSSSSSFFFSRLIVGNNTFLSSVCCCHAPLLSFSVQLSDWHTMLFLRYPQSFPHFYFSYLFTSISTAIKKKNKGMGDEKTRPSYACPPCVM